MLNSEESDRFPPSLSPLVTTIGCLSARTISFCLVLHVVNSRLYEDRLHISVHKALSGQSKFEYDYERAYTLPVSALHSQFKLSEQICTFMFLLSPEMIIMSFFELRIAKQ